MKDLLEYIVKNLVSKPEDVIIEESSSEGEVNFGLSVHPDDVGMVIGKSGQTIRALRKLLIVRAMAENAGRVNLNLVEQK